VDCHGCRLALVFAQDVLAIAHIRFAQLALFDGLLWSGFCRRSAFGCRWAWWIATTRCLASSRDLGGGHGGRIGLACVVLRVSVCVCREVGADQRECDLQWCRTRVVVGCGVRACMWPRSRSGRVVVSIVSSSVQVEICASRQVGTRWMCDGGAVFESNMEMKAGAEMMLEAVLGRGAAA
jgi:hypothetical protein